VSTTLMNVLAAVFQPGSEESAILLLAAVVCWVLAAFASTVAGRFPGGALGLIALGLALWFWSDMWNAVDAAF
jgi:hypothetical protein